MISLLKSKAKAATLIVAAVLMGLQIILPTIFDLVLGGLVLAMVWAVTRTDALK